MGDAEGQVDPTLYDDVRARLEYQAGHAIVWRDAIVQYFLKQSGIPDAKGRAGHYPGPHGSGDARLTGYKAIDVTPWEDASGGKAVTCDPVHRAARPSGPTPVRQAASMLQLQYFDLQGGVAKFALSVDGKQVGAWTADGTIPSRRPHGDNSVRHTVRSLELKPGDVLRVGRLAGWEDAAALDYVEVEAGGR